MSNRTYQTRFRSGLIGMLSGESLAKSLARTLEEVNDDEQRVVFMVRDSWSIWRWLGTVLLFIVTIGLVGCSPGYLLVTEASGDEDIEVAV